MKHITRIFMILFLLAVNIYPASVAGAEQITDSKGYIYEINESGATLTGVTKSLSGKISIPATVNYNNSIVNVTAIGAGALSNQTGIKTITVPYNVVTIAESAFANCTGVTRINLPSTLTGISELALTGCTSLETYYVDDGNSVYSSDWNNCLCNKDGTTLLRVPQMYDETGVSYEITAIGSKAFAECSQIESLDITEKVTSIADDAFGGNNNIIIYAPYNSYAGDYAKSHGITYRLLVEYGKILTGDDGKCQIEVTGSDRDDTYKAKYYKCLDDASKTITIPEKVLVNGETFEINDISGNAFSKVTNVNRIVVGEHISYINSNAFKGKKRMEININIGKNNISGLSGILYGISSYGKNNHYTVKVPKGKYNLERRLYVQSNTTLILTGVTFKPRLGMGAMIELGNRESRGYKGGNNIKVIGGTLDAGTATSGVTTLFSFSHVQNVTIDGMTFKYLPKKKISSNGHMIEFGGSKNVTIKNCRFYNNKNCAANNEAIQIESTRNEKALLSYSTIMGKRDGTQCGNVTINGCYFSGFNYGCGSNHLSSKDHFKNMKFTKNTFVGAHKYCICIYNYKGVTIKGNKTKNCGSLVQNQYSTGVKIK